MPIADLGQADEEIAARMGAGLDWNAAAAQVYQELGQPVDCPAAWASYMALRGSRDDEHAIVSLKVVHAPFQLSRDGALKVTCSEVAQGSKCTDA